MAWVLSWTWASRQAPHAPASTIAAPLPDQPPERLPRATRAALLQRALSDAQPPAPRRLDILV